MLDPKIKFGLGLAGVPEKMVADIENALPAAQRLIATYQRLSPDIAKVKPDLDIVAPVIAELLAFIQK